MNKMINMNEKDIKENSGFIILIFTLGIVAVMYMLAFHYERRENKELENKIQKYQEKYEKNNMFFVS